MLKRLREPSTYAGLAAVVAGVGQMTHAKYTAEIASGIADAAPHLATSNWTAALMAIFGSLAMILREGQK